MDPERRRPITAEERGNLALLRGLAEYTRLCAPHYADPCAAGEMEVPQMIDTARGMLSYAPETLRRGAMAHAYGELLAAWHVNPDTLEWVGTDEVTA